MAPKHVPGAAEKAQQDWCDSQAELVTRKLTDHLADPVSLKNKDEVLKQIQNWIIRERRRIKAALEAAT